MSLTARTLGTTGVTVSSLGLGTSPLGGCGLDVSYEQFEQTVMAAYEAGIRYFDCAPLYGYGRAEHFLGHVLRTRGIRPEVTISTKVGRVLVPASKRDREPSTYPINWINALPYSDVYDYSYDGIMRSAEDSQQRLGIDGIDIVYVHDIGSAWFGDRYPHYLDQLRKGGFRALDQLRSEGSVKAVGLGVNETQSVLDIAGEFKLDCAMVAGRYSLLNHAPLEEFFPRCQELGISIVAAGVFNSGILAQGLKGSADQKTYDCQAAPDAILKRVADLEAVAARHGVALPTAALQFVYGHPAVAAVVVGAITPEQIRGNVGSLEAPVPDALWDELKALKLIPASAPTPRALAAHAPARQARA